MAVKKEIKKQARKNRSVGLGLPSDEAVAKGIDNSFSGDVFGKLSEVKKDITFEVKDIPLSSIVTNPDNELFRALDDEEDIGILAEDIKRNGLLHNLVVYPETVDGVTRYVLLSGERRFKALNLLQKRGDARWNIVQACRVVKTDLSENERKVLLYSANLQVRGGFANEMVRRKAVAEFVSCLQKEPFNLTPAKAKAALKEISPETSRVLDRDLSIEREISPVLRDLLDEGFLPRRDVEKMLPLPEEMQKKAAEVFSALAAINNPDVFRERELYRRKFMAAIQEVLNTASNEAAEALLEKAVQEMNGCIKQLTEQAARYEKERNKGNGEAVEQKVEEATRATTTAKRRAARGNSITSNLSAATAKLQLFMEKKGAAKKIEKLTLDEKNIALKDLNDMIETASRLKRMLEEGGSSQ